MGSKYYLKATLRPYQEMGRQFLVSKNKAVLADGTGLGKTVQALAVAVDLFNQGHIQTILVVTKGTAGLLSQWQSEAMKFTSFMPVLLEGGAKSRTYILSMKPQFLLVPYHILFRIPKLADLAYDLVICDEAQAFKNPQSKTAEVVKSICSKAKFSYALTATPITNSPLDIWSISNAIGIDTLGTQTDFENTYIQYGVDLRKTPNGKYFKTIKIIGYHNYDTLKQLLKPFVLRRLTSDPSIAADLPELNIIPQRIPIEHAHRNHYVELLQKNSAVMNLQQALDYCVVSGTIYKPKIEAACDLIAYDLQGAKVLVWAFFKNTIAEFVSHLQKVDFSIQCSVITGDTPQVEREPLIEGFLTGSTQVLVSNVLTEGKNLQAASVIVLLDPPTNPKFFEQLVGRIRRQGSVHKANFVYPFLLTNTHEIHWWDRMERREAMSATTFGEDSVMFPDIDLETAQAIISDFNNEVEN